MHADFITRAVSDSIQKTEDVGGEPGTPETAPAETCKRTREFEG